MSDSDRTAESSRHVSLDLYAWIARAGWPRSYAGKLMLAVFAGINIPVAVLLAIAVMTAGHDAHGTVMIVAALVLMTVITGITLRVIHGLLAPVLAAHRGIREYMSDRQVPALPTNFSDEAGELMAGTRFALAQLDSVIQRTATYDDLTGLPNTVLLTDRLVQAVAHGARAGHPVALIRIELDSLDEVIAAGGRAAGESMVRAAAQRLAAMSRDADIVARLGSAGFAIVVPDASSTTGLVAHATRIHDTMGRPLTAGGITFTPRVSVGVALFPSDASDADELLRHAGAALHAARIEHEGLVTFFAPTLNAALHDRLAVERDLRLALERDEIFLEYQPQLHLRTGRLRGVEALVRWRHPRRGLIPPVQFIPVAEATGMIVPVGARVLLEACRQIRRWSDAGHSTAGRAGIPVAVNLSARQFTTGSLVETVREVLAATGADPALLELEITETAVSGNLAATAQILRELRTLGITVALDDFGTGYSSLSYLQQLPVDVVKIDRTFVMELGHGRRSAAITDAVLALAQGLGLTVVAEGVETIEQIDYLRARGCDVVQGFHVAPPLPAEAVEALCGRVILAA